MAKRKSKKKRSNRNDRPSTFVDEPSWWERQTSAIQHAICLALLVVVSIGFFSPIHFSGKQLIGGDAVQWRGMAESIFEYERETGETGLWAPNAFAGMPGYMISYDNQIPQVDDIPGLLRRVIWPSSHFIFLLVGAYLLVFFLTRQKWAGVLGAVAYGLTSYLPIILSAGHNSKFIALCFAPWLALTFIYALRRPRLLSALFFAIAFAANLRAGHPQITYNVTFLIGIWWIAEGIAAFRRSELAAFGKATAWLVLGTVLGFLMLAQPYMAEFEYKDFTTRGLATAGGEGGMGLSYAMRWSQGPKELITLLISGSFGGGGGLYWGPKPFTAGPHYVGGTVILLALLALWRLRRAAVWGIAAGAFLMILFSLGRHFMTLNAFMYDVFPFFDAFRAPETWLSIVAMALAVLAGYGAYVLTRPVTSDERSAARAARSARAADGGEASAGADPPNDFNEKGDGRRHVRFSAEDFERNRKAAFGIWGGLTTLVVLLLLGGSALFSFERPNEQQRIARQFVQQIQQQRPDLSLQDPRVQQLIQQRSEQMVAQSRQQRAEMFSGDAWRTLIFLLLAGGLLLAFFRRKIPGWVLIAGLALLVTVDLWGAGRDYINEDKLVRSESIAQEIPRYDFDQYLIDQRREAGGKGHFRVLSYASGSPLNSSRASYFHESLGGYHGAKLGLYQDFVDYLYRSDQTGLPSEKMLDMLNVRYIVSPQQLPETEAVYQGQQSGMTVLRNPDALSRAFFVGDVEVIPSAQERFDYMTSAAFEPAETAVLTEPLDAEVTPIRPNSTTSVTLQEYSAHQIQWQVRTDAPRLLVVSEVYYPAGWEATIDGEPAPILQANHFLRAVPIPEGEHTVRMTFRPQTHYASLWIAGTSTAVVYGLAIVLLAMGLIRRRSSETESGKVRRESSGASGA